MAQEGNELKPGYCGFDDVAENDRHRNGGITVTETRAGNFSGVSGDLFDIHTDDAAVPENGFPRRIAQGSLGLALADGLKVTAPVGFALIAWLSWTWPFRALLLIGDRISGRIEIREERPTKTPGRGILTLFLGMENRDGTVVQDGKSLLMCHASAT